VVDSRNFNSDNEDYDSDDYAKTMAPGAMMLRNTKPNFPSPVDASHNMFAWNDPQDIPQWFVDNDTGYPTVVR
jgi:hypothetical protein